MVVLEPVILVVHLDLVGMSTNKVVVVFATVGVVPDAMLLKVDLSVFTAQVVMEHVVMKILFYTLIYIFLLCLKQHHIIT